jgi:hypothetical protein
MRFYLIVFISALIACPLGMVLTQGQTQETVFGDVNVSFLPSAEGRVNLISRNGLINVKTVSLGAPVAIDIQAGAFPFKKVKAVLYSQNPFGTGIDSLQQAAQTALIITGVTSIFIAALLAIMLSLLFKLGSVRNILITTICTMILCGGFMTGLGFWIQNSQQDTYLSNPQTGYRILTIMESSTVGR